MKGLLLLASKLINDILSPKASAPTCTPDWRVSALADTMIATRVAPALLIVWHASNVQTLERNQQG